MPRSHHAYVVFAGVVGVLLAGPALSQTFQNAFPTATATGSILSQGQIDPELEQALRNPSARRSRARRVRMTDRPTLEQLFAYDQLLVQPLRLQLTSLQQQSGLPYCGDGNVDAGEQCDDGNAAVGDGCTASCLREGFLECLTGARPAGELFRGPDGCDWCVCTEGGGIACLDAVCPGGQTQCLATADCARGEICSTERGDCQSPCAPNQSCIQVCSGTCVPRNQRSSRSGNSSSAFSFATLSTFSTFGFTSFGVSSFSAASFPLLPDTGGSCGDGVCESNEPAVCPGDCASTITQICGDGLCAASEACIPTCNAQGCLNDCGSAYCFDDCGQISSAFSFANTSFGTAALCGNGLCESGEGAACAQDCGSSSSFAFTTGGCQPIVCMNGTQYPTCTAEGHPVNYFVDPCMTFSSQGAASSAQASLTTFHTCGNGMCENGESAFGCDPTPENPALCDGHVYCPEDCGAGGGQSMDCATEQQQYDALLAQSRGCVTDADCVVFESSCPFVTCAEPINVQAKASVASEARDLVEACNIQACAGCQMDTTVCVQNRCTLGSMAQIGEFSSPAAIQM